MRLNRQADLQQGETELRRSKLQKNSIVFKISMVITVLFATVICLLVGYNIYSFSAARRMGTAAASAEHLHAEDGHTARRCNHDAGRACTG